MYPPARLNRNARRFCSERAGFLRKNARHFQNYSAPARKATAQKAANGKKHAAIRTRRLHKKNAARQD